MPTGLEPLPPPPMLKSPAMLTNHNTGHPSMEPASPASPVADGPCAKGGVPPKLRAGVSGPPSASVVGRSLIGFTNTYNINCGA